MANLAPERIFDNIVRVYDKNMNLLAIFDDKMEGASQEIMWNQMVSPTVRIETNGASTLTFQMLANSEKWAQIKDPENLYHLNGRWYTALSENAYEYAGESNVRVVNVTLVETWYLLDRKYNQAYNCGIYCYAKAKFVRYTTDGAIFTIDKKDCSNAGDTISNENTWAQVKNWTPKDEDGNKLTYAILTSDKYKPTNWENQPSGVFIKSISVSGDTATIEIEALAKTEVVQTYDYTRSNYKIDVKPLPASLEKVQINTTTVTESGETVRYETTTKDANYTYSTNGTFSLNYTPTKNETVNAVISSYGYNNLGDIKTGATCTFAYGAEVVDTHTFIILPRAKTKYKLTINGTQFEDSQVKDARGVVMPRGSGGYAMWAALYGSGWTLGVCDVIAKDFDASNDYGSFNVESDMQDVLYNIKYIQELYGGILDWDSENKVLNYRAENSINYQAYNDGFNAWTGYEFRMGKNMTEVPVVTCDNNIITKAFVLGYGNLNINRVNGGLPYVTDFSYTNAVYEGYLKQELIYDTNDEGGQKQLLYWAKKAIQKKCRPRKTIRLFVTDIRTTEGYEHEVFDINNVVHAYYRDEHDETEIVEEQRIVLWEYNAFAMYDCTVELGEKTQNERELFKLFYKSTLKPPGSDASGNISSDNIHIGNGSGNDFSGVEGDTNLTQYIQLIARTTTQNSDAIAGLILDTSATKAQVDLFATYEKKTDNMINTAYAGLQVYADEKSSQAILEANKYTETTTKTLEGQIQKTIIQTEASFKAYADSQSAAAIQSAQTYTRNYVGNQLQSYYTKAQVETYTNSRFATAALVAELEDEISGKVNAAYVRTYVDNEIAGIELTATDRGGYCTLQLTSGGVTIDSARVTMSDYDDTVDLVNSWVYHRGTYIDGEMLATGTVQADSIRGRDISIYDYSGNECGYIVTEPASSYNGRKITISSAAMELESSYGDLYISANRGRTAIQLKDIVQFTGDIAPGAAAYYDCGTSRQYWGTVYAQTGTIQTSDRRKKKEIDYDVDKYEVLFDKLKPCSYKFNDRNRTHTGMIAQDLEQAMEECGILDKDFAALIKSPKEDGDYEYGIRYSEFVSLCIAEIQKLKKRIKKLEGR